ncbi:hypothetical protein DPSP01_001842 [Paraphaeosphaeria sporulosa]
MISWEVHFEGLKVRDGDVCSPYQRECVSPAANGEVVYNLEAREETVKEAGWHTWGICAVFVGMEVLNPDTFLVDHVEVWGPFE